MIYPLVRFIFAANGIRWGENWHFHGLPDYPKTPTQHNAFWLWELNLRSSVVSNPLGPNHPVILCTWEPDAVLEIGDNFAMTGWFDLAAET